MRQILFVDDEPQVLEGLRDLLRPNRRRWKMYFELGGAAAMQTLRSTPIDVVVTDMRMPGIDGAALLDHVKREYPRVARIVLSGYSDTGAALRAVPVAHQYLSKPCERATLESTIERVANLHAIVTDERLQSALGGIESLPSMPQIYLELVDTLARSDASPRVIAALLEEDMALCAKVMQVVTSSFFGLGHRVQRIEDAVMYLGRDMISGLVLAASVFDSQAGPEGLNVERLQSHALTVGTIARNLLRGHPSANDAYLAGVLHDVGVLLTATYLPDRFVSTLQSLRAHPRPLHVAEVELWQLTHAEVGAYLLALWGLPHRIVDAVAYHHRPDQQPRVEQGAPPLLDLCSAVYLASALASEIDPHGAGVPGTIADPVDLALLDRIGMTGGLAGWRDMAAAVVGGADVRREAA